MTVLVTLLQPFGLGLLNMTNPCVLPLYPGFLAFLAGNQQVMDNRKAARWLGAVTLAGLLASMLLIGLIIALLQIAAGRALSLLLPIANGIVILMGVLLVLRINPLARLPVMQSPRLKNPLLASFLYGVLYGPMTLPCNSPLVVGAFANAVSVQSALEGIAYFLLFGLGFGVPLLILPLLADPVRKSVLGWMTAHYNVLTRIAGVVLIAVGLFGLINEWPLIQAYWQP